MQCDNCGYIFFQPSKKCNCCGAPYAPTQSAFDVGQENLFTIYEMAPGEGGIPSSAGMTGAGAGIEDHNFTDDFETGGTEYGVDENVLELGDAKAEGFGTSTATKPMSVDNFEFDTSGMDDMPSMEDAKPDVFDLNLSDDLADNEVAATEALEPAAEADDAVDTEFASGFDDVEGLGFGFDESPAEEAPEGATEETSLDAVPELEAEMSLEPELELAEEEPSLELSEEPELDTADEPSLELSEDLELPEEFALDMGELDAGEGEPSLELPEEPELMETPMEESAEMEDEGGIAFDLDGVDLDEPEVVSFEEPEAETFGEEPVMDLDEPEVVSFEEPEAETFGEEPVMDFEGLEMETPDEPEDEDLTK